MSRATKAEIADAERTLEECAVMRKELANLISANPEKEDLRAELAEVDAFIAETESNLATYKEKLAQEEAANKPKWNPADHPAFRNEAKEDTTEKAPKSFQVNDMVMAQWTDRQFYKARILMVTGSAAAPKFRVKYVEYNETADVEAHQIKPLWNEAKKRKADGNPVSPVVATTPTNPAVISAAPTVDPELAIQARQDANKLNDGPTQPPKKSRKLATTKRLTESKNKWQDFMSKGPSKKKDSMFRTGNAPNARVGFTGSGAGMTRDRARGRHVYQPGDDREDDQSTAY